MRIVLAPNAFKGTLTAVEAALAMAEGIRRVLPEADLVFVPIADGGDGTVEALVAATGGERRSLLVRGPLHQPVQASYGLLEGGAVAVIEMARASGLALLPPDRRDPRITTTYGVGELLQHAYDQGARRFIVGIGGSATNDGGAGMAQALGYHLLDARGLELPPGGAALASLDRIHVGGVHGDWSAASVQVASDVTNPLTGPHGASAVYGPQKGATPQVVAELDAALRRLAAVIGAELRPGADLVMDAIRLDDRLRGADLVLTGEGRLDAQTARFGKGPAAVARRARAAGIPVIAIAGGVDDHAEVLAIFDGLEATVSSTTPLEEAM